MNAKAETDKIRERYEKRKAGNVPRSNSVFDQYMKEEREKVYLKYLNKHFGDLSAISLIEIGAGEGGNLEFFHNAGVPYESITAIELLEDRSAALKLRYPKVKVITGDASCFDPSEKFDVVFQSTVFTSILDTKFRFELAQKLTYLMKPEGIVLWYDFTFDNPSNPDVKGVSLSEIIKLFPGMKIESEKVTLAPPIGRRIGHLYKAVNFLFPFLRTHLVACLSFPKTD